MLRSPAGDIASVTVAFDAVLGTIGSGPGQLYGPCGVAAGSGSAGEVVYVADTGNQRVQYLNQAGDYLKQIGRFGVGPGDFNNPFALALDYGKYLFVVDKDNHRVQQFDVRGIYVRQYPDAARTQETLRFPQGIASFGELYVADTWNDRVVRFDRLGQVLRTLGGFGSGRGFMNRPTAVAVDSDDNLYVADSRNHRIQKFNHRGDFLLEWGRKGSGTGFFEEPQGLWAGDGVLVVADTGNKRIQVFDLSGRFLAEVGGSTEGGLTRPVGVCISVGKIYVADAGGHRIVRFILNVNRVTSGK